MNCSSSLPIPEGDGDGFLFCKTTSECMGWSLGPYNAAPGSRPFGSNATLVKRHPKGMPASVIRRGGALWPDPARDSQRRRRDICQKQKAKRSQPSDHDRYIPRSRGLVTRLHSRMILLGCGTNMFSNFCVARKGGSQARDEPAKNTITVPVESAHW